LALNRLELSGRLLERGALRLTPAGLAALEFKLAHESEQDEAGGKRKVHAELAAEGDARAVRARVVERLETRLRVRVDVVVGPPGSIPRQEVGKARRVWERTGDEEPFR